MPPRQANGRSVKGPSSALTSFLAELGVEPSTPITTWGSVDAAGAEASQNAEAGPSQTGQGTPESERPAKRARAASIDSDDLDAEDEGSRIVKGQVPPEPLKAVGEFMDCGECAKRFTVTAYTKEHPKRPSTWLCVACCHVLKIDPFAKPKKTKPMGAKKVARGKVVHYETRKGVASLGEICIKIIGRYIEDVEQLGDIGNVNMDKVCRIISKSRRLTPDTAPLFYSVDRKQLAMYDCTRLDNASLIAMAILCPGLEALRLDLCGQMTAETIKAWGNSLSQLRRLELVAPFLVRKEGWVEFFEQVGPRLKGYLITQSPRIDLEVVESLVKNCPHLTELRLAEIGQMSDVLLGPLGELTRLELLDLSSPGSGLTDQAVSDLLSKVGANLVELNLSDTEVTDEVLPAIAQHCSQLRRLKLRNLNLDSACLKSFFDTLRQEGRGGLQVADLEKGHDLKGDALLALLVHSGSTLERLSICGWSLVESEALEQIGRCKVLQDLDLGWCRQVTDFVMKELLDSCPELKTIRVWGCNQLTDAVPRRRGVNVIGIETHAI